MNILFIGDIVGRPGRELVRKGLRALIEHHGVDLTIANAENAAAGFGVTKDIGDSLLDWGVDVMTSGNHIWDKKEVMGYIASEPRLLRPANYPAGVPGRGSYLAQTGDGRSIGIINVMGRVFMLSIDDPFAVQGHLETKDPVRGGMLRSDVDDVGRGADVAHGDSASSSELRSTFSTMISPSTGVTGGGAGGRCSKRPNRVSLLPPPPVPSCPPPRSCAAA